MRLTARQKGILAICASAFGFAVMAFAVRLCDACGASLSCFQKGFFRNAIACLIAAAVFIRQPRREVGLSVRGVFPLAGRVVCGTIGIFANFYALSHIPISDAMTLNKTAPFFTVLGAWIFLRESFSRRQFAALVIAFAGALCVIRPGFAGVALGPSLWGLGGGLAAGLAYTCLHQLGRLKVSGPFVVLVFSAFSCLASVPFLLFSFTPMTFAQLVVLLLAGAGAALGQFGITAAYRLAEPRTLAVYDYSNIIFTAILGFFFLGQTPDPLSILGFLLIVFSAVFANRRSID